ncbi:prephenate dehydrogenase [Candidatus Micrarchaeota archaeon]|nr:prephenate dehydrogenase [Candidatus Micrarchaeota archaeon]
MRIAIIGNGKMGRWLASHLRGHKVKLYGRRNSLTGISAFDIVILAVSLDQMLPLVRKLRRIVKPHQLAFDIASVKSHFIKEFKKLPCRKASIHPMFGPKAVSARNQNIILISDVGNGGDQEEVAELFNGAKILRQTANKHDETMAHVLCLPYSINFAFIEVVKNRFDKHSGPTFRSQKQLASSVLESAELGHDIIRLNPHSKKVLSKLIRKLNMVD